MTSVATIQLDHRMTLYARSPSALGSAMTHLATDHRGASNAVYFVALANGERLVVRVSPVGQSALVERELWALNQARAYGAPVPEVIFAATTRHEYPAPYMVMRRLPGVPAFEVSLTPRTRATILEQLGRHLLAIHSIPLAGFGYLELQNGVYIGRSSSWWAYVREEGERRLTKLPTAILPPPLAAAIERRFEQTRTKRELDQAVLLHGDYQLKNILVQNLQVTGILDFENLLAGDPVLDFCALHFCALHYWSRHPATTLRHLLRGYGRSPATPDFLWRLYRYELLLALEILWWEDRLQARAGLRSALARLARIVAILDTL